MISWDDPRTEILLNPRLPPDDARRIRRVVARAGPLDAHVWLTTSGSTGRLKPVALAKRALLASAEAVNAHLESTSDDVWINVLPSFHVGGLGIYARASLTGAQVVALDRWTPNAFPGAVRAAAGTLAALVPAQVFDLVRRKLTASPTLRAVVVGGGPLSPALYERARDLGWPLLPSYGATECSSQVATATLASLAARRFPELRALTHIELRTAADGRLEIRSPALFTGYATERGLDDPKRQGWWRSDDLGTVVREHVRITGRADDAVKIGGELVALGQLRQTLETLMLELDFGGDAAVCAVADDRLGTVLHLASTGAAEASARLQAAFNARVAPYERLREVRLVREIPRTALGKTEGRSDGKTDGGAG